MVDYPKNIKKLTPQPNGIIQVMAAPLSNLTVEKLTVLIKYISRVLRNELSNRCRLETLRGQV